MPDYFVWRKIRRIGVWRGPDWNDEAQQRALDEIYDVHVRENRGFSLWRVANENDRRVVAAVMFELANTSKISDQYYFVIPESNLQAWGYQLSSTPEGTSSSHRRAPELHHDLLKLSKQDCEKLTGYLREHFGNLHVRVKKSEIKTAIKTEIENFQSDEVRRRLARAGGAVKYPG